MADSDRKRSGTVGQRPRKSESSSAASKAGASHRPSAKKPAARAKRGPDVQAGAATEHQEPPPKAAQANAAAETLPHIEAGVFAQLQNDYLGRLAQMFSSTEPPALTDRRFSDEAWRDRRNKVKQLREVLREGGTAVEQFRRNFNLPELPELDQTRQHLQEQGWDGTRCGYFDAIEALDFYLPLPQEA